MQFLESMLLISKGLQRMPPIVLHCRDARKGPKVYEGRAASLVLELLRQLQLTNVKIHRHCFIGSAEELCLWTYSLPNCYFGFAPVKENQSMSPEFQRALSEVPLHRILLETNAPYVRPRHHSFGTPWLIMSTAETIARVRRIPPSVLVQIADINARQFYELP
jgi:TatD DNase family protein